MTVTVASGPTQSLAGSLQVTTHGPGLGPVDRIRVAVVNGHSSLTALPLFRTETKLPQKTHFLPTTESQ